MGVEGTWQPQRLLMTADAVGGVWTYALELCRELCSRGSEVTLAVMGPPPSAAQTADAFRIPGVDVVSVPNKLEWMDEPWDEVDSAGEWLAALEQAVAPDIVHLNGFVHAAQRWQAPVLVVGHSCVASWWSAVKREPLPHRYDEYRRRVERGLRSANVVVAPSRSMLAALHAEYDFHTTGRVIPNGRSVSFPATPKEPIVLTTGRLWDEAKNASAVAAVAADLPWPVYLAGDTQGAEFRNVQTLGRLEPEQVREWFARASIYALPARYEPFGLSVLEAALAGCALVLGDIGSLRENWSGAAVFVPPDDRAALSRAINGLISDPMERSQLAQRAQERAQQFRSVTMANAYLDAYTLAATFRGDAACA
jgi:glycogen(starch) synthase